MAHVVRVLERVSPFISPLPACQPSRSTYTLRCSSPLQSLSSMPFRLYAIFISLSLSLFLCIFFSLSLLSRAFSAPHSTLQSSKRTRDGPPGIGELMPRCVSRYSIKRQPISLYPALFVGSPSDMKRHGDFDTQSRKAAWGLGEGGETLCNPLCSHPRDVPHSITTRATCTYRGSRSGRGAARCYAPDEARTGPGPGPE